MFRTKYITHIKNSFSSKELLHVFLSFFLFAWVLFIATPFDIVVSNPEEFILTPGSSILWNSLIYASIVFSSLMMSYVVIALLFSTLYRKIIISIAIAFAVSSWLNSTFFIGIYGEFDGRENLQIDPFSPLTWIQIGAFLGIFLFAAYTRNKPQIVSYVVTSICFISFSTGVINISSKLSEAEIYQGDEKKFFSFSKTNHNLLLFLLDEYQSDYFSEILDDKMKSDLDGFVWYKDTSSNFPTTIASIPAIFSGEVYQNDIDIKEFYKQVSAKSFANRLLDQDFQVSYTNGSPMTEDLFPDKALVTLNSKNPEHNRAYNDLLNYSTFRVVPDLIKLEIYNNGKWLIQLKNNSPYDKLGGIGSSFKRLDYIANKELLVTDGRPTFKFHHSYVTHSPTVLGSSCEALGKVHSTLKNKSAEGRCAMSKAVQIINNLKDKGVFDNTMIIITADHGSVHKFLPSLPYHAASSTLLIKPLNSKTPFQISNSPALVSDLPKTIAAAMNIPNISYPGFDLLNDNIPKNRNRTFSYYYWSIEYHKWSKSRVPPIIKYQITGPLNDAKSWKRKAIKAFCEVNIAFSDEHSRQYYLDSLSRQEHWGRWSDGDQAQIEFQTKADCKAKSVTFNLKAFLPPKTSKQTAKIFVNNKSVGEIQISKSEAQPKQFIFALPQAKDNKFLIRFEIDNPTSTGNPDNRKLGFGFVAMKLSKGGVAVQ